MKTPLLAILTLSVLGGPSGPVGTSVGLMPAGLLPAGLAPAGVASLLTPAGGSIFESGGGGAVPSRALPRRAQENVAAEAAPDEPGALARALRLQTEETARLERQAATEALLGDRRLRQLRRAHFHLQREQWFPGYELEEDQHHYERVKDTLLSGFKKLGREVLEERLEIDLLEERLERRWRDRRGRNRGDAGDAPADETRSAWRMRFSPQARVGIDDSSLGMKLQLLSDRFPLLAKTSFQVGQSFDDDCVTLRLKFAHREHFLQLEGLLGDEELGDAVALFARTSF